MSWECWPVGAGIAGVRFGSGCEVAMVRRYQGLQTLRFAGVKM